MSTIRGIGVDIADVGRFSRLFAARGEAFAQRWFTAAEVEQAMRMPHPGRLLAERFAVKEAVWKALGPGPWAGPLPWRAISTESSTAGGLAVTLTGRLAEHGAKRLRIRATVSSTAGLATAFALVTRA